MKKTTIVSWAIILLLFALALYVYPLIPAQRIASHWNSAGQVNGYMSKFWGLFLVPFLSVVLYLLFTLIPKIDPLSVNIKKFRSYYDLFVIFFLTFLLYVYSLTIYANLGHNFNMTLLMIPAIGVLFIYLGFIMSKLKRNWFIGIRTPWTISNEKVWDKTHKLGGKLFILCGLIDFIGLFFMNYLIWFILLPLFASVIWLFIYSYLQYKKITKHR